MKLLLAEIGSILVLFFCIMVSFDCFYTYMLLKIFSIICVGKITTDFLIGDCKLKGYVTARGIVPLDGSLS